MYLLTVSDINFYLQQLLETDRLLSDVWIQGEISNLSQSSKGHFYFTLKDGESQLSCVLFKQDLIHVQAELANGQAVIAHGRVSIWKQSGKLQFYVDIVQPEGTGRLELEFQALKAKLEAEGLFDESRKRSIPKFPSAIGIVTSKHGAVLHDILNILRRRYPLAEVILSHTQVQGDGASLQIAAAIEKLHKTAKVDVIILARGGGSREELWAFNEECVARAIYACPVPVISAIGHETDYTIADYVADLRAPTPSAAAELVVPNVAELRQSLDHMLNIASMNMRQKLRQCMEDVQHMHSHLKRTSPIHAIHRHREKLSLLNDNALSRVRHLIELKKSNLETMALSLNALNPKAVLGRGYSVTTTEDGKVLRSIDDVGNTKAITTRLADGFIKSMVDQTVKQVER
ncbi:exodeoxyribonuclease VII, large subunit [Thermobaculum terrenum ATCC BAA-798]|uniref:Exodeoxyribonuclease 7 large subunit n=1 Tax=Thermobaculum terrenum (strain ATCC BAA-798 / CCMEE 7001 / YNP1) TaxID=525904 RepID=D1CCQ3_THET1|nr:exodeoxyribonuclease VII large subunit [Thermobaculum terrenum]ACZ42568.1 exodeoxyribonuclease VII, large subunit [Thermobaculum terrenum ATCC BAA-798]